MRSRHIHRAQILADGHPETLDLSGPIIHIATRAERYIEIWYIDDPAVPLAPRTFQVFGTGQPLPDDVTHVGSAVTPNDGRYVWHLFERTTE